MATKTTSAEAPEQNSPAMTISAVTAVETAAAEVERLQQQQQSLAARRQARVTELERLRSQRRARTIAADAQLGELFDTDQRILTLERDVADLDAGSASTSADLQLALERHAAAVLKAARIKQVQAAIARYEAIVAAGELLGQCIGKLAESDALLVAVQDAARAVVAAGGQRMPVIVPPWASALAEWWRERWEADLPADMREVEHMRAELAALIGAGDGAQA